MTTEYLMDRVEWNLTRAKEYESRAFDKTVKIIETNDGHGGIIRTPYTEANRKRAILRAIGLGFTMKEIADKWDLTVQQVREIKGQK